MSESGTRTPPVALRILRPYRSEDELLAAESSAFTRTGVVLVGAPSRPNGVVLRFEIALADGTPAMRGEGRVVGYRPPTAAEEGALMLRFTRLDVKSKALLDRAVAMREERRSLLPVARPTQAEAQPAAPAAPAPAASRRPTSVPPRKPTTAPPPRPPSARPDDTPAPTTDVAAEPAAAQADADPMASAAASADPVAPADTMPPGTDRDPHGTSSMDLAPDLGARALDLGADLGADADRGAEGDADRDAVPPPPPATHLEPLARHFEEAALLEQSDETVEAMDVDDVDLASADPNDLTVQAPPVAPVDRPVPHAVGLADEAVSEAGPSHREKAPMPSPSPGHVPTPDSEPREQPTPPRKAPERAPMPHLPKEKAPMPQPSPRRGSREAYRFSLDPSSRESALQRLRDRKSRP